MDNLKKYLQQHLEEMDTDVPVDRVWQRIQKETTVLPKRKVYKLVFRYAAAACVLAFIAAGIIFLNQKQLVTKSVAQTVKDTGRQQEMMAENRQKIPDSNNKMADETTTPVHKKVLTNAAYYTKRIGSKKVLPVKKKQLLPDPSQLLMNDIEQNYAQLINRQLTQLRVTPVYAESPDYFSSFKQQQRQLELDEASLKKEIRLHGLTDELLQQLINISQQKLNLLKDLQAEIKKLNNKVRQIDSPGDSSRSFYLTL